MPRIRSILSSRNRRSSLKNQALGYVLILMAAVIPVLLFGTKYVLDRQTVNKALIENGDEENGTVVYDNVVVSGTAAKAAKSVAKNWNPGLTLTQQKDAIYKVADAIYNNAASGTVRRLALIYQAVPGLDERHWKKSDRKRGTFDPLEIEQTSITSINPATGGSVQAISYETKTRYDNRYGFYNYSSGATWNPHYAMWRAIDANTDASRRKSIFDELNQTALQNERYELDHHEIFKLPAIRTTGSTCTTSGSVYYPNNSRFSTSAGNAYAQFIVTTPNIANNYSTYSGTVKHSATTTSVSATTSTYTSRVASDKVKISIDTSRATGGAIRVQTDDDIAYAKPAECNVDIVLAIPVNGAASNVNNEDAASSTSKILPVNGVTVTTSIPTSISGTPIYEMGQACKEFVKEFYHFRGVTMGLIPYSGKVSLSPDKTGYTAAISAFREPSPSPRMMIGACLYGTSGEKDAPLIQGYKTKSLVTNQTLPTSDTPYYWGGMLTGCPIMSRRGTQSTEPRYGNNYVAKGNLTSIANPTSANEKYRRMNLAPCYGGYTNMLSMRCERECTHYLPNPYYMIEPTADLVKIYEMCNALYPFYDTKNVSNFLFIPLEWTRNFFQSWTNNPSASASSDQLSRPSKTASGRKKVLILLVNKPDWFEPGEMTYLGFDNDISEVPMVESDKIDFSINYGDSSKKFLDGSYYDGTIAGPKKILRIEKVSGSNLTYNNGYYEANGTYRLKFPRKGLVKLKVAQPKTYTGTVTFYTDNITDSISSKYDVRKDSTSGTSISLGTAQTVTGSQEFVFSGGSMPSGSDCCSSSSINTSQGKNFCHNLSVKKVRYSLSNATITSDTRLKNQILRYCIGGYAYNQTKKALRVNNGDIASRNGSGCSYGPNATYGIGYVTVSVPSTENTKISRFSDPCFEYTNTYYFMPGTCYAYIQQMDSYPYYTKVYGVDSNFYIAFANSVTFSYLNTSNNYTSIGSSGGSWSNYSCNVGSANRNGFVQLKVTGNYFGQYYIKNTQDKTLQSTTPITVDPITYTNLIQNKGIYLANYNNENWICFQGDGELHVTVEEKKDNSKWWYDLSSGGTSSQQTITGTSQTITIPSSAFKEDHGRYVAKVYFRNAFVKSLTQQPGTRTIDTIESTINPSSSYPLVYSYENPNGSVTTTYVTSMSYDSSKSKYYVDLPFGCLKKHAAIKFSKSEAVDDFIEFYSNLTSKHGSHYLTASFGGSNSNYFYTISGSYTGRLTIADKGIIELTVAPKFDVTSGTIKFGSGTTETIDKQKTFKIEYSDMVSSGSSYYFDVTCNNLILIKAKYYYRPDISFPYDMERTQILDWRNSSMSTALSLVGSNISMSGSYNNYNSSDKYHRLNTSSCCPTVQNTKFTSDISAVVNVRADSDSQTKMFLNWYMPEYYYSGANTYFTGAVRLFSPMTRDSARNYCQLQPYSSTYNNMSNILAHSFTTPYNSVLYLNNYQGKNDTPTEAVAKVTADVCSKLKSEHGSNLRIYLIKYRKQSQYKTFPAGETKNHSYKTIEDCANFKYEVTSKGDLVSTLKTIADNIKKSDFAGHSEAVEC